MHPHVEDLAASDDGELAGNPPEHAKLGWLWRF